MTSSWLGLIGWLVASLAEILLLLVLIIVTTFAFAHVHSLAGALLLPYVAWVMFATALTWAIWRANGDRLPA